MIHATIAGQRAAVSTQAVLRPRRIQVYVAREMWAKIRLWRNRFILSPSGAASDAWLALVQWVEAVADFAPQGPAPFT